MMYSLKSIGTKSENDENTSMINLINMLKKHSLDWNNEIEGK